MEFILKGEITKEFLILVLKEIVDPDFGLFKSSSNGVTLQPNPKSGIVPDHLNHFKFLERMIGKKHSRKKNHMRFTC